MFHTSKIHYLQFMYKLWKFIITIFTNETPITHQCMYNIYIFILRYSGFSRTHKIANIGIFANFVFPYIFAVASAFVPYDVGNCELRCQYKTIIFLGWRFHWSGVFLMVELKRSWQYWLSCIMERL